MEEKINEEVLCILKYQNENKFITLNYESIINSFKKEVEEFCQICDDDSTTLDDLINYFNKTHTLNQLNGQYKYCTSLSASFQGFTVNLQETIKKIRDNKQLIIFNKNKFPNNYNDEEAISLLKNEIRNQVVLWSKAFAINKAYKKCYDDKTILTFSHRINGWSNPVYNLNSNFSIELKTNFGFGSVSYFYVKIKYKDIEITPFSDWIEYEFARFSEIIRYTQSFYLDNKYWYHAMKFSMDACNLSIESERKFIDKYVIGECERMVNGLEEFTKNEHFTFKKRTNETYKVDKTGHILIEFRGEKISGALNFISKIIEYKKITEIQSFIKRIENLNKKIQPILINECIIINEKLKPLNLKMAILKPKFLTFQSKNSFYLNDKEKIRIQLIRETNNIEKELDYNKLNNIFLSKYPNYPEFEIEFKTISNEYNLLSQEITNLQTVLDKINKHNQLITEYFINVA